MQILCKKKKKQKCEFRINFLFHKETYPYYTKFHYFPLFNSFLISLKIFNFSFFSFFSVDKNLNPCSNRVNSTKKQNSWRRGRFFIGDLINSIVSNFHECQGHLAAVDSIHSLDQRVRTLMATLPQNCSRRLADYYGCVLRTDYDSHRPL